MKKINVLSLFDGIAGAYVALERAGFEINKYYSSEIDKYAMGIANFNNPDIVQLGDIDNWKNWNIEWNNIDLLIGGSPCQNLSQAGDGAGLNGKKSKLFFTFIDIKNYLMSTNKNAYFLLENVKMQKKWQNIMTRHIGFEPILINSSLVSAQNRKRLYWSNFPIEQPEDRNILLKNIVLNKTYLDINAVIEIDKLIHSKEALVYMNKNVSGGRNHWDFLHHSDIKNEKSSTVVANFFKGVPYNVLKDWECVRKFHPIEVERLQTFPDGYTEYYFKNHKLLNTSSTQRLKTLGNSFTVDVIAHILVYLRKDLK